MGKKPRTRGCLNLIGLFLGLGLVALVALKLFEDGRGKKAWDTYVAEQQALGNPVLWQDFVPPQIPDEDNMLAYPDLDLKAFAVLDPSLWPSQRKDKEDQTPWRKAQPWSLAEDFKERTVDTEEDAAQQLLTFFGPHTALLDKLADASKRPHCRFDLDYSNPHLTDLPLGEIQHIIASLKIRGIARLRAGEKDEAHADLLTLLRLIQHLDSAPSLVVAIVQIGHMDRALQLLWEGLKSHAWDASQLESISQQLTSWEPSQRALAGIQEDRAGMLTVMEQQIQASGQASFRGWAYQNMTNLGRLLDQHILSPEGQPADTLDYDCAVALDTEVAAASTQILGRFPSPYKMLAIMTIPTLRHISLRSLELDAYLLLANEAIKVEITHQREGRFPTTHGTTFVIYSLKDDGTPLLQHTNVSADDPPLTWQYTP